MIINRAEEGMKKRDPEVVKRLEESYVLIILCIELLKPWKR